MKIPFLLCPEARFSSVSRSCSSAAFFRRTAWRGISRQVTLLTNGAIARPRARVSAATSRTIPVFYGAISDTVSSCGCSRNHLSDAKKPRGFRFGWKISYHSAVPQCRTFFRNKKRLMLTRSSFRSLIFLSIPPAYPVRLPFVPTTR